MSTASTSHRVDPPEIAELLAWRRRLSVAGPDAGPTGRAAYLAAKTNLLTQTTDPAPRTHRHEHDDEHDGEQGQR